jgi:hypothetical protein
MGPRFKVARRLGVNVFNHPKALRRGVKKTNQTFQSMVSSLLKSKS